MRTSIIKSIVNRGRKKGQTQFEKRRTIFFNTVVVFIILSSLIMVFLAQGWDSKLLNILGLSIFIFLYYVHKFKPSLAVIVMGILYQIFIFIHSSVLDIGGHVEYGALAMTIAVPIFFKRGWSFYFLVSNFVIFYYPYLMLDAYDSFFKISYVFAIGLFFSVRSFVKESAKYEAALIKKQYELIELNKEKNHLIQVVAHDLKSPLNQIEGLANLIELSDGDEKKHQDYLSKIVNSVHHMSSMITRILDVEKIEKQKSIELISIEIVSILKNVIEKFRILAEHKDIKISEELIEDEIWIKGDTHYFEQIIHNLLSNAIKFSSKGKQINVAVEKKGNSVKIEISDEGPGISLQDQEKLFMKFQKLSAQPTNNEDSTGLGLALAKSFVEALNGSIICESQLGYGATFITVFPIIRTN